MTLRAGALRVGPPFARLRLAQDKRQQGVRFARRLSTWWVLPCGLTADN